METETTDRPQPKLHKAAEWMEQRGELAALTVYWTPANGATHRLNRGDLQAIVQQAYDMFGILAVPSLETEAGRVEVLDVLMDQAHNAGARA